MRPLVGVRELRERRMMTQRELADAAGVSEFTIQRIERGEGAVRPKTGRAIAEALGVRVEDLLEDLTPKAQAPLFFDDPGEGKLDQRRASYLDGWRTELNELADRWDRFVQEVQGGGRGFGGTDAEFHTTIGRIAEFSSTADGLRRRVAAFASPLPEEQVPGWERYVLGKIREASNRLIRTRAAVLDVLQHELELRGEAADLDVDLARELGTRRQTSA